MYIFKVIYIVLRIVWELPDYTQGIFQHRPGENAGWDQAVQVVEVEQAVKLLDREQAVQMLEGDQAVQVVEVEQAVKLLDREQAVQICWMGMRLFVRW